MNPETSPATPPPLKAPATVLRPGMARPQLPQPVVLARAMRRESNLPPVAWAGTQPIRKNL